MWRLLLQQPNCLASTVHQCTVLLKHSIRVTVNATHDWQHFMTGSICFFNKISR